MKNLKAILTVSLFVVGLSFTSCSNDDKYIEPEGPVHLPSYSPELLPDYTAPDNSIERPDTEPM